MKKHLAIAALAAITLACGNKNMDYDASGIFEATEVIVSAETVGRIVALDITEGDSVTAGDPIGLIDTVQLHLKKLQLETSTQAALSRRTDIGKQIAATTEQIKTAQTEKARFTRLLELNAANRKQIDDIDAQIAVLQKQLAAQRSTLENANASVSEEGRALLLQADQTKDLIERSIVKSPIDGTILSKYAQAGEMAVQGRALFKVADMSKLFLRAYLTSGQLSQVKLGQPVRVFADYGKTVQEYAGTVTWISDKAEFTPKSIYTKDDRDNLVYAVKIAVQGDGYIKIGMYGQMKF